MIYTYRCNTCKTQEDRRVKMDEQDSQYCEECKNQLEYVPTFATAVQFKGHGWTRKGR
jgi:putative FmdB family regulatory protein